jgi:hypothetical protein
VARPFLFKVNRTVSHLEQSQGPHESTFSGKNRCPKIIILYIGFFESIQEFPIQAINIGAFLQCHVVLFTVCYHERVYMFKYVLVLVAVLSTLLGGTQNLVAQESLPRIGVRKWTIDSLRDGLSTAVAYARNADRLFVGTWAGSVLVVDTKAGRIIDTIRLSDYPEVWKQIEDWPQQIVDELATTYDGQLVVLGIQNLSTSTLMVEYPSKRLLDSAEMGIGDYANQPPSVLHLSPKGTFVKVREVIINRKNGMMWSVPEFQYRVSFDTAETVAAYNTVSTYKGISYKQLVALQYLDDTIKALIQTNLWGIPTLSADGTKLMTAGAAWAVNSKLPGLRAKAVVMNIADSRTLWQIYGDDDSPDQIDFARFAWKSDGTTFFGVRHSLSLSLNETDRLYRWPIGSSSPNALVDDRLVTGSGFQPIFNDDMSEAYAVQGNAKGPIYAVEFSNTGTTVPLGGLAGSDTIYPNPTNGSVTVRCSAVLLPTDWTLSTMDGRTIASGNDVETSVGNADVTSFRITLPMEISSGQYLLTLKNTTAGPLCTLIVVKQ